ncbi:glycosyltransferase [Halotalea alkalilenta]|uniref:Glycosyl transferase family 1 n=1 Tax=Halotalea alkalilenta TaxID=376489 RepID=A0A172YBW8_9GAMM|nr:glycosyltransferase [Halotalea alkalilenta]ANF56616.1 glycosyl transferase family 1 [Halotalea alkalilenta]
MTHKVLQLCLSTGWGGLEMYPSRIIAELKSQGWQVYGAAIAGSSVERSMRAAGVEVFSCASRGRALLGVVALSRFIRRRGISVVHCHKSSDLRICALLKTLDPSLRVVFTEHMGVSKPKRDLYHRWAYGRVDQVLAISDATLARNRRALPVPSERLARLYQGLDLARHPAELAAGARCALRASLGIDEQRVAVGLPGRLTDGKGHLVWLDALAGLPAESRIEGLIIGGREAREGSDVRFVAELDRRIEALGLGGRVRFSGFRADLPQVLAALDIVCVPSRNEAFGLTVIEAMAAGRAVICADAGALPEIVTANTGLLVGAEDVEGWREAMLALERDPARRAALGAAGRLRVEQSFELGRHVEALIGYYTGAA